MTDSHEQAYQHAWNWFALHANQRQSNIQFSISFISAVLAAVGYLLVEEQYILSLFISIFGAASAVIFLGIDRRNAYLVKLSEKFFEKHEAELNAQGQEISISRRSSADAQWHVKYSHFSAVLHSGIGLLFVAAAVISIVGITLPGSP